MASILIGKETCTVQVVKHLEHRIETGELPPLTKLTSIRNMAREFGVSMKVILFALEELEKKRLIHRVERKGIYVSEMASNPDRLEVLILVFGDDPERNHFIHRMMSLTSSRAAMGKLNFYTRIVTFTRKQMKDGPYLRRQLEAEVAKLSQTFHSDCALILGPELDRQGVEICLTLPFPVLFLGNFKDGDFTGLHYNRLGIAPNSYNSAVCHAHEHNLNSVSLIHPDFLDRSSYFLTAQKNVRSCCEKHKIRFVSISVSEAHDTDPEHGRTRRQKIVEAVFREPLKRELLILSCLEDVPELIHELAAAGWRLENGHREIIVDGSENESLRDIPGIHFFRHPDEDNEAFNQYLCRRLLELSRGELVDYREDYSQQPIVR